MIESILVHGKVTSKVLEQAILGIIIPALCPSYRWLCDHILIGIHFHTSRTCGSLPFVDLSREYFPISSQSKIIGKCIFDTF